MWISKKKLKELQKRVADLEVQVQSQQNLLKKIAERNAKIDDCPIR